MARPIVSTAALLAALGAATTAQATFVPHSYSFMATGFSPAAPQQLVMGLITVPFDEALPSAGSGPTAGISGFVNMDTAGGVLSYAYDPGLLDGALTASMALDTPSAVPPRAGNFLLTIAGVRSSAPAFGGFVYAASTSGEIFSAGTGTVARVTEIPGPAVPGPVVPAPAALPLLASALAVLGGLAWRRRAKTLPQPEAAAA